MAVIHSAGKPIGFIQRCQRCGVVLQDYTNALGVGDWHPVWWDGNVLIDGRFSGATEEPANCKTVDPIITVHISKDADPKTIEALGQMMVVLSNQVTGKED